MTEEHKETEKLREVVIEALQDKKAHNLISIDLRKAPEAITDYFIVCHGNSNTQVSALADGVLQKVKEKTKRHPYYKEGLNTMNWVLLDYADVVVHIFYKDTREFYQLEELWSDAPVTRYEEVESNA